MVKKLEEMHEYTTIHKVKDIGGLVVLVSLAYLLTVILFAA